MPEALAQAASERSGNVQAGRVIWIEGTTQSAAADAEPERRQHQQRRYECDAKACQKKQRFKCRKGKLSSLHPSTLLSVSAASFSFLKLIYLNKDMCVRAVSLLQQPMYNL